MWWPLITVSALAQTWSNEAAGVLVPEVGTLTENGVGSPTVVWDPDIQRYVMFFETMTAPAAGDCINGEWSIGAAVSDDGLTWDVYPDPIVSPTPDTPWRCVAAHPTVVLEGGRYDLYFKAEQGRNPCATGAKPWGCKNYTGVSHALLDVALDDFTTEILTTQAEITTIETTRDTAMDTMATDLVDFRAALELNQSVFACAADVPVCVPCGGKSLDTLNADQTYPSTHTFCQPFEFAIPSTITATPATPAGTFFTLTVTPTVGAQFTCNYRKRNGVWVLDYFASQSIDDRCTNSAIHAGTLVTAGTVQFGHAGPGTALISLSATNVADQTSSGGVYDSIDALLPAVQAYDYPATQTLIGPLINDLTTLGQWLVDQPGYPVDLFNQGLALYNSLFDLDLNLTTWSDQLVVLYDQLAVYQSYTQSVIATVDGGVALAIPRSLGYPSVMHVGADWLMVVQDGLELKRATAAVPEGPFTLDATPILSPGIVSWAMDEVFEPNLICDGGAMPYQMYFGGRTLTASVISDGGISDAFSSDTVGWVANVASRFLAWVNPDEYRHFDVVRNGDGEYRMWYSEKVGGLNQVGVNVTTPTFDDTTVQERVCP